MATLKELINANVDKAQVTFRIGTVTEIDMDNDVCTVEMVNGDADRPNVQLKAIIDGESTGFITYPKLNTMVVVGIIDGVATHSFIAMCTEVDKVKIIIGDNSFIMDANTITAKWAKWQFNDGNYGGIPKVIDPNDPNGGVLARLNKLETALTTHITEYNTHQHPTAAVGPPSPPSTLDTQTISLTQRAQIEDDKITH